MPSQHLYEGDDAPTINVPAARLPPPPPGGDDAPMRHVPSPKRVTAETPTLAIPAPRVAERDDPQTLSMSAAQQRALLASLSAPPPPLFGEDTLDAGQRVSAEPEPNDFETPTMVGGITEASQLSLAVAKAQEPRQSQDDAPTPLHVNARTDNDDENSFDVPTLDSGFSTIPVPSRATIPTKKPTLADGPKALAAQAVPNAPSPKAATTPDVRVEPVTANEVTTAPSLVLAKGIMLQTSPSAPAEQLPDEFLRPVTLDALSPVGSMSPLQQGETQPLSLPLPPMPLSISEADITTSPSTTMSPEALPARDPSLEQITAPTSTTPPLNSQLAGVVARPSLPRPPTPAPTPAPPANQLAEPTLDNDEGGFREDTSEAFRLAAPPASMAALKGLKRASPSTTSSSATLAAPSSSTSTGSLPPSKAATRPPKPKAPALQTEKTVRAVSGPSPASKAAPPSEVSPEERRRYALIAVSVCVAIVLVVMGARFLKSEPKAPASLAPIALPAEAVSCRRVTTIGKDLMCDAPPASLNALAAPERTERIRVTKEAATAAGFARIIFVDKERVWRVIELKGGR